MAGHDFEDKRTPLYEFVTPEFQLLMAKTVVEEEVHGLERKLWDWGGMQMPASTVADVLVMNRADYGKAVCQLLVEASTRHAWACPGWPKPADDNRNRQILKNNGRSWPRAPRTKLGL